MTRAVKRRLVAGTLLLAVATGSVFFWNDGDFDSGQFAINLAVAVAGFAVLHQRWRAKEKRALTPRKVEDIFS